MNSFRKTTISEVYNHLTHRANFDQRNIYNKIEDLFDIELNYNQVIWIILLLTNKL